MYSTVRKIYNFTRRIRRSPTFQRMIQAAYTFSENQKSFYLRKEIYKVLLYYCQIFGIYPKAWIWYYTVNKWTEPFF